MNNGTEQNVKQLRRTKSVACAEEIQKQETQLRSAQPDKPCHKPRDSLFSWSSGFGNFTGFVNWAFLLLFMGGTRLFLENLIKYGIRVDPEQWLIVLTGRKEGGPEHPSLVLLFYAVVPALTALYIEKGMAFHIISQQVGMIAHVVNITILVLIPMVLIHSYSTLFSLSKSIILSKFS
ncbi:diacylglycerol O-acyltransferase 1-like [Bemisia tabaci]|uniref:diacylglycerol O-acyltransferase 1-like n=1 Tax=Bemisia tabaci TaxID=7038 RepID=UPI003B281DFF